MTQETLTPEQIKRLMKIQALLDKAAGTNIPAEAATFMEKAQALLTQYALDEDDLEKAKAIAEGRTQAKGRVTTAIVTIAEQASHVKEWKQDLMFVIARTSFCRALTYGPTKMVVIGNEFDLRVVEQLYFAITNQLQAFCERDLKIAKEQGKVWSGGYGTHHARSWRRNYLLAAAWEVRGRLNAAFQARKAGMVTPTLNPGEPVVAQAMDGSKVTALVIKKEDEIQEYIAKHFPKVGKLVRENPLQSSEASELGKKAGREVQLGKGLGEGSK